MKSEFNGFSLEKDCNKVKEYLDKMASVLAAQKVSIWEYEVNTGTSVFADNYQQILGFDKANIEFTDLEGFLLYIHPDDLSVLENAFSQTANGCTEKMQIRYRCVGKQGEVIWLETIFFPFNRGNDESSGKVIAYTVNITADQLEKNRLKEVERRYEKIINVLPDFIFIFDRDFNFSDVLIPENMSLYHTKEELIGFSGKKFFSHEVIEMYIRNIKECLEDGKLKEIEYHLDVNGVRHYFQARLVPFEDDKVLAVIRDIGDRVRRVKELLEVKKKAEEAERMKSAFLANMSHEVRTPLNAIVGFAEILTSGDDPDNREDYVSIIRANSNLLLQLIDDILDLSRIDSGKSELVYQDTEAIALIEEVAQVQKLKMKPGVELEVIHPGGQIWFSTDKNRLIQVLLNFLSNARKNTERGKITLKLESENDGSLTFSVSDTGRGIPEDRLSSIFNRFEKLNSFDQGTGLGLAICKELVERMGGNIKVDSVYGKGSTFSFTLPYIEVSENSRWKEKKRKQLLGATHVVTQNRKILIAETSEADFKIARKILTPEYEVYWARTGEETIQMFIAEEPELILMNIRMPGVDSLEITKRVKNISVNTPIVAVSEYAIYMEQQWALENGCVDIVAKPYSASKLKEVVLTYI